LSLLRLFRNPKELWHQLSGRTFGYWARLLLTIIVVNSMVGWLDSKGALTHFRWSVYNTLERLSPGKLIDKNTVVVTIDDGEYWLGRLNRRAPIKRDYLADLLNKLDAANASVIALDFDLRSPAPDGNPREDPDYVGETGKLLETVKSVSLHRPVVLPKTLWEDDQGYLADSDIYDGFDFGKGAVTRGYILLPYDALRVPVMEAVGTSEVDSLSVAIARAFRPTLVASLPSGDDLPYGSFLPPEKFERLHASEVLSDVPQQVEKVRNTVQGRVVIVGGNWSRQAYGRGDPIDSHETPIGFMPGVYVHANYVEAILNGKTYAPLKEVGAKIVEWVVVVLMAISFATTDSTMAKVRFVIISWILLAFASYFAFVNLGMVFDLFVPAVSVTIHWVFEQSWEAFRSHAKQP
jgi:CHASE2 domain-containing sensor protein